MSVDTLCQICEARTASEQCRRCGALVCQKHYDESDDLCFECAQQVDPPGSDETDVYEY